jgi:DNA-binding response OmpR family regulator
MPDLKRKILVVEEDPLVARMLVECLAPLGAEARAAHSGREAVDEAQADPPDLILLATSLPDMDGFSVAARLKEHPATQAIPFILVTGQVSVQDRVKGLELGAADTITKPFYYEEVRARVLGVLQRAAPAASGPATPAAGIQGRLEELSLPMVVQMLGMEQKTGVLELEQAPDRGTLHFAHGEVVDATWREHRGEPAAYRLIRWTAGHFRFVPAAEGTAPERRIAGGTQHILMEAMRLQDEGQRILDQLPPASRPLRITAKLATALAARRPTAELKQLLDLIDGKRTLQEILDALPDELKALETLQRLHQSGLIEGA